MLPVDQSIVCRMFLYSVGFQESRLLAQALVNFHRLCSDLLSPQPHYDFNIRTIKAALTICRRMKHGNASLSEIEIVASAIWKVNSSKIVDEDRVMFKEICTNVFPNFNALNDEFHVIHDRIKAVLGNRNLAVTTEIMNRILQLYSALGWRSGIVILGDAMSGKTTMWQTLADTLRDLKSNPIANITEYDVSYRIINPKAITLGQLFGQTDADTLEWCDGVCAKTVREMAAAANALQSRAWLVFDGPIDPLWMESLHTFLDDNRKLCLASGEMIEKTSLMTILFETTDLENASPATVARCGVVYVNSKELNWKLLHSCFVVELKTIGLSEIYMTLFETLTDWLVPAVLEILAECETVLPITAEQQYKV